MNHRACFRTAAAFVAGVLMLSVAGCGEQKAEDDGRAGNELKELSREVAQLKAEVREIRSSIDRRQMGNYKMRGNPMERPDRDEGGMTNGVSRMRHAKPRPTREDMEARRKMMQDPEMRKKFEAEHKARMEERRRRHEERRREMEARRRAGSAPEASAAPAAAPAK